MTPRTISDAVTAAVTRTPALATTLTSTPRPSAAIEMVVRMLAVVASGFRQILWDQADRPDNRDNEEA